MSFNFQSVIFFSFFTIGMSDVSKKRGKKKKKEEEDTAWTPKSGELDTKVRRVVPILVSDTCRTPTRRQNWHVCAT